jgi:hypothetical protein
MLSALNRSILGSRTVTWLRRGASLFDLCHAAYACGQYGMQFLRPRIPHFCLGVEPCINILLSQSPSCSRLFTRGDEILTRLTAAAKLGIVVASITPARRNPVSAMRLG